MTKHQPTLWTKSFLSVFMATLLVFTAFYLLLPTLPLFLSRTLEAGPAYTGIILAAFTLAAVSIRPVTGYMIDRYGRKWIYLAGLVFFTLSFSGYMIAYSLAVMVLLRLIHGLFWGITTTAGSTIVVDLLPPHRRGEGLGYFGLAGTIPMAIGPMLGLYMAADNDFNPVFIAAVGISLLGALFALGIRYPKLALHTTRFTVKNLFEISSLPVALVLFINMITYGGVVSFISMYVKETGTGDAGIFFLVYAIGITLARLFSGKIFDREGPLRISIVAFLMISLGFLLLSVLISPAGLFSAAFIMGLGGGVLFPACQAMVNNMVEPGRRGAANSTLFTVLDLGIGVGMILTGYLAGFSGLKTAFLVCCILNIIALMCFLLFTFRHYQRHKLV